MEGRGQSWGRVRKAGSRPQSGRGLAGGAPARAPRPGPGRVSALKPEPPVRPTRSPPGAPRSPTSAPGGRCTPPDLLGDAAGTGDSGGLVPARGECRFWAIWFPPAWSRSWEREQERAECSSSSAGPSGAVLAAPRPLPAEAPPGTTAPAEGVPAAPARPLGSGVPAPPALRGAGGD